MARPTRFLIFFTLLVSTFVISTSAAPTTFAEVEKSWQRGLSEKDIHTEIGQHPTPSYHSHLPSQQHPCDNSDRETGFQGMLDERTMAVRRKMHNAIWRRGMLAIVFGQKREQVGEEGSEDQEVLRPVRNRRWQF